MTMKAVCFQLYSKIAFLATSEGLSASRAADTGLFQGEGVSPPQAQSAYTPR